MASPTASRASGSSLSTVSLGGVRVLVVEVDHVDRGDPREDERDVVVDHPDSGGLGRDEVPRRRRAPPRPRTGPTAPDSSSARGGRPVPCSRCSRAGSSPPPRRGVPRRRPWTRAARTPGTARRGTPAALPRRRRARSGSRGAPPGGLPRACAPARPRPRSPRRRRWRRRSRAARPRCRSGRRRRSRDPVPAGCRPRCEGPRARARTRRRGAPSPGARPASSTPPTRPGAGRERPARSIEREGARRIEAIGRPRGAVATSVVPAACGEGEPEREPEKERPEPAG